MESYQSDDDEWWYRGIESFSADRAARSTLTYIHTHTYIYTYIMAEG